MMNDQAVFTAQLEMIAYPNITARTETGAPLTIETNEKQRTDPAFWASVSAILTAKLWVPVSKRLHQLLDSDWLAVQTPAPQLRLG